MFIFFKKWPLLGHLCFTNASCFDFSEMVETSTDSKKTDEPLRKAGQDETSQCLETPVENTVDDKHMENSERTKKTEQIGSEV